MASRRKKQLVKEFRLGLIRARVSSKYVQSNVRFQVELIRLYRNGDTWKESTQFGRDDLPLAAKVLHMAHSWIYTQDPKQ